MKISLFLFTVDENTIADITAQYSVIVIESPKYLLDCSLFQNHIAEPLIKGVQCRKIAGCKLQQTQGSIFYRMYSMQQKTSNYTNHLTDSKTNVTQHGHRSTDSKRNIM